MRARILLIQNDAGIREKNTRILQAKGYILKDVAETEQGSAVCMKTPPDLVVLDLESLEEQGPAFLDGLRQMEDGKGIPVIMILPEGLPPPENAENDHHVELLFHPVERLDLMAAVKNLLARRKGPESMKIAFLGAEEKVRSAPPGSKPNDTIGPLPLKGELKDTTLGLLFLSIYHRELTGVLEINQELETKWIYFVNGSPINADSNVQSEDLINLLLAHERIDEEQYRDVEKLAYREECQLEEAVIKCDLLTHKSLFSWLKLQARQRIINCMAWKEADYSFIDDPALVEQKMVFKMNPLVLITEGMELIYEPTEMNFEISRHLDRYVAMNLRFHQFLPLIKDVLPDMDFPELLNGTATLGAFLDSLSMAQGTRVRALRTLLDLGMLDLRAESRARSPKAKAGASNNSKAATGSGIFNYEDIGYESDQRIELLIDDEKEPAPPASDNPSSRKT